MPNIRSNWVLNPAFEAHKDELQTIIDSFGRLGNILLDSRNTIKSVQGQAVLYNIKSFKPPHLINKIAYRFFRKSKARRSFENARLLLKNNIQTPAPIAYLEQYDAIGLTHSYYICAQLTDAFVMTDVLHSPNFPNKEKIVALYTAFHYQLHQAHIAFLDNTQGNTLFVQHGMEYTGYLVDLNRMHFGKPLNITQRMQNFARLTRSEQMMKLIAAEYARLSGADAETLFSILHKASLQSFARLDRKKKWKRFFKSIFKSNK